MSAFGQANFLQALGWAVLNSLWQMALLWVIYQFITGIYRNAKSTVKTALASLSLFTGFGWFVYTFISILVSSSAAGAGFSSGLMSLEGNQQLNKWLIATLPVASIIYLGLLILPVLHFIRNFRYVQIIRNYGLSKAHVEWRMFVRRVANQMGIKKPVNIWISELVSSPVTVGYLKPVILVPLAAINNLSTQQLEAVLLHELSHIRRYDYLINLVINFIQSMLYFNPFVKALVKTVEREREKSCDEMVIQFEYDPHGYASALLILEKKNISPKPLAVAASGKKNDLLHRVELILGVRKKQVLSFNKLAGLFAGLLCIIGMNALLIFSKPGNESRPVTVTQLFTPFYFFDTQEKPVVASNSTKEASKPDAIKQTAALTVTKTLIKPKKHPAREHSPLFIRNEDTGFVNVSFDPVVIPKLKGYQEEQVKIAVDASKKVMENAQWKKVEKSVADVFTLNEKAELRKAYLKEINRIDWNKWEDRLRLAYNKVDWDKLNEQLGRAVNRINLDSIQKVYADVANNLGSIQQQLLENNLNGIPDTDISISEVQKKQLEVLRALDGLKAARKKKIVHL